MALKPRKFFLDVQDRIFVAGPNNTFRSEAPIFFNEDVENIELYFLQPNDRRTGYRYIDISGSTVSFAVGVTAPAALQTVWTAGGLSPISASASVVITGGSGTNAEQRIDFAQRPDRGSFAFSLPARTASVASITNYLFRTTAAHGLYNGQPVTLTGFSAPSGFVNGGTYIVQSASTFAFAIGSDTTATTTILAESVSGGTAEVPAQTTATIPYNANAASVQAALDNANISATASGTPLDESITLAFSGSYSGVALSAGSIIANTLYTNPHLSGNVNFATTEIADLLNQGITSVNIEVQVSSGALRHTFTQAATLAEDIISALSPSPLPVVTATSFSLLDSSGDVWTISVTPEGELQLSHV